MNTTTETQSIIDPPKEVTGCPVCGEQIPSDNTALNRHLDDCLSLTVIHETAVRKRPLNSRTSSPNKRQCCVEEFWT